MELHAVDRVPAVFHRHDLRILRPVRAPRGDDEVLGKRRGLDHEGVVPHAGHRDRKSTRLNSSHGYISYAVFCLKKKKKKKIKNETVNYVRNIGQTRELR